jgi:hypothetical protein
MAAPPLIGPFTIGPFPNCSLRSLTWLAIALLLRLQMTSGRHALQPGVHALPFHLGDIPGAKPQLGYPRRKVPVRMTPSGGRGEHVTVTLRAPGAPRP